MISYTVNGGVSIRDYRGMSADEKPVNGVPNGSSFYEMDTKALYLFDEGSKTWILQ